MLSVALFWRPDLNNPPTSVGGIQELGVIASRLDLKLRIPPTAVGGWFRSNLHRWASEVTNPTNGSWWMVSDPTCSSHRRGYETELAFECSRSLCFGGRI